jgi:hypothetical protein
VLLHGVLKRAKRKGWIDANPAADAERVTVTRSGDFNVLSPEEVQAVARAEPEELYARAGAIAPTGGHPNGARRARRA